MLLYQIAAYTIHGKTQKKSYKNNKWNEMKHGMKNLNYLMDHILCQIFKIISSILSKTIKQ